MPYSKIDAELTDDQLTEILAAITTIENSLEVLVNLTPEERMKIPKMGDLSQAFVAKSIDISLNNPHFVPPFIDHKRMEQNYNYSIQLRTVAMRLSSLLEKVTNTSSAAGSEALRLALLLYKALKSAALSNEPGASSLHQDLSSRFPRRSSKKASEEEPVQDPKPPQPTAKPDDAE